MPPAKRTTAKKTAPRKTAAPAAEATPTVEPADSTRTAPKAETAPPAPAETVPGDLALGDKGADVKRLQGALGVKVDGTFGPVTERALRRWQKARGRNMTGTVNARTWRDLGDATDAG